MGRVYDVSRGKASYRKGGPRPVSPRDPTSTSTSMSTQRMPLSCTWVPPATWALPLAPCNLCGMFLVRRRSCRYRCTRGIHASLVVTWLTNLSLSAPLSVNCPSHHQAFYAKGRSYHHYVARDATRSFATGCTKEECLVPSLVGCTEQQKQEALRWLELYEHHDRFVGMSPRRGPNCHPLHLPRPPFLDIGASRSLSERFADFGTVGTRLSVRCD
jgi:hypothetical protein